MQLMWLMICIFIVPAFGLLTVGWIWEDLNNRWPVAIGLILIVAALVIGK